MNIADKFIDSIYDLTQKPITNNVMDCVKKCLIDYLGATIGGSAISKERADSLLATFDERGDYSLFGYGKKTSLQTALLVNGISSHMAELDDGVISGIIHPGSPIFTALLAIAEKESVEWNDFAMGVVIGYESCVRIANAIQPAHKRCGYHATGTCGTIGVALGIAAMLGFGKDMMKQTLSIAMASSHGTLKVLEDASELKPYNIASAAINGTIAALSSKAGYHGADDPFSGEAGFLAQMTTEVKERELWGSGNGSLYIENVYFKPYAACRYTHPSIEASMSLKKIHDIDYHEIENILVETYELAVLHHDHVVIPNISSAKMSIPYSAAVSMITDSGGANSYTDQYVYDDDVKELVKKVKVLPSEEYSKLFPEKSCAKMTVTMKDKSQYDIVIDMPKGEPDNPLTDEDLKDKFTSLFLFAGRNKSDAQNILTLIDEKDVDLNKLINTLYNI